MSGLIRWLEQVWSVTIFSLLGLRQRLGSSLVTIVGIAGVVVVFIGILSVASGFRKTLQTTGDPESVMVMRGGSSSEMTSGLELEEVRIISDAPGLARGANPVTSAVDPDQPAKQSLEGTTQPARIDVGSRRPLASGELYVVLDLPRKGSDTPANVPLRGVDPQTVFAVRGNVEMLEGRPFEAGRNEVIVGQGAALEFDNLELGDDIVVSENTWKVVGVFTTGGTVSDSEIWTDARVLQPAYRRGTTFQSVHARLESPEELDTFKDALTSDPRLDVKVQLESEYHASQSVVFSAFITAIGVFIGLLMGIGAVFGAANTMYTSVSTRTREIATLRALGFGIGPVVFSVMAEALALATIGGVVGSFLAYSIFNGFHAATINFQTFSQIAFSFAVTPALMIGGIVYAIIMGFVSCIFPAFRAALLPVATALREL